MLVDWNVLQMVLVLLLAAESELGTLIELICVALTWNIHHDEILTELVLVRIVHPYRVVIHLTVVLHCR